MNTLLHIDTSANPKGSLSHQLTAEFVESWKQDQREGRVVYRDLGAHPIPSISPELLSALWASPETELPESSRQALAISNTLIDELIEADHYVFGIPMYNFSVPGVFKDYIDQVARMGRTWAPGPKGMQGLSTGKKGLVISTRAGDYEAGGPRELWDFHKPFLQKVFAFLGVEDLTYIPVMQSPGHENPAHVETARLKMEETLQRWSAESLMQENPLRQTA